MKDERKFRALIYLSTGLALLVILYNVLQGTVLSGIEGYLERRIYYERAIIKRGLDLHEGMHWKEKE